MKATWASERGAAAEQHAFNKTPSRCSTETFHAILEAHKAGADFGRATLLSELQAAEERERRLVEALEEIRALPVHRRQRASCMARDALALRDKGEEK